MNLYSYLIFALFQLSFICISGAQQVNGDVEFENFQYEDYSINDGILSVRHNTGVIRFKALSNQAIEVLYSGENIVAFPSFAISDTLNYIPEPYIDDSIDNITFGTSDIRVTIAKSSLILTYTYRGDHLIEESNRYVTDSLFGIEFKIDSLEKITGGGERVLGVDRHGQDMELYNKASYGYEDRAELMYYSMPMIVSEKKYMVIYDNGAKGRLDIGNKDKEVLAFSSVGGRMSYIVVAGESWSDLSNTFSRVVGYQPMIPRWALGNISSRMGYHSQRQVENVVSQYESDSIPLDAIVLDLYWFGKELKGTMGNLSWHRDSFPSGEEMVRDLRKKGIKTILITEPFVLQNTNNYDEVVEKELVGKTPSGEPYVFDFYFGTTVLLDIFNPLTKKWFWNIYKHHIDYGISGWWGDLGEPEVHPSDLYHENGLIADDIHNLYGHEWAKSIYEGYQNEFPAQRPVILMRSGFVGTQRYGIIPWSGDVNRSWKGLSSQVEIATTMGLMGLGYMHSDLGGFAGDYKDAELYTRWLQYGAFQPIFRTHGQEEVPAEPIYWDRKTKNIVRRYINLRYQLTPYNYTLAYKNATSGTPLMRPLYYEANSVEMFDHTEDYMWGDCFLVHPIVDKGVTTQDVYLPDGHRWVDIWTEKIYNGGDIVTLPVDINDIPIFVKSGSFIPMIPKISNMDSYSSNKIILHYFHDKAISSSHGMMYEDDGISHNSLEVDAFVKIEFEYENKSEEHNFNISTTGLGYRNMPSKRTVELVIHNMDKKPCKVILNELRLETFEYNEISNVVNISFVINDKLNTLKLKY